MEDLNVGDSVFVASEQEYEKVVAVTPDKHYYLEGLPCPYVREELATAAEFLGQALQGALDVSEFDDDSFNGPETRHAKVRDDVATLLEVGESTIWSADPERKRRWYAAANRMRDFFGLVDL